MSPGEGMGVDRVAAARALRNNMIQYMSRTMAAAMLAAAVPMTPALASGGDAPPAPVPVIEVMADTGQAPFAVHANALGGDVGTGDLLTTRFQWDFGDPGGAYNRLEGFNAAHLYETPGDYTLTLTVTNDAGLSVRNFPIFETADARYDWLNTVQAITLYEVRGTQVSPCDVYQLPSAMPTRQSAATDSA